MLNLNVGVLPTERNMMAQIILTEKAYNALLFESATLQFKGVTVQQDVNEHGKPIISYTIEVSESTFLSINRMKIPDETHSNFIMRIFGRSHGNEVDEQ
jgi:hypothetical protein